MITLEKITFINTKRFIYGEVDVSGNTLVTGTNGAGKTTTIQAILFFYGSTKREKLGIPRNEGKDNWAKFTYPLPNSYVFYKYKGLFGDVLLMTYAAGSQIGYRFISIDKDYDIKSITMNEDNSVKVVKEVLASFVTLGFKPSNQVTAPEQYRKILYGAIDARKEKLLSEFVPYALIKAQGKYSLIHDVQSSIFLSSRVETGTIESAIASSFGDGAIVDILQLKEQLQSVMQDYEAIQVYDKQGSVIADIFKNYTQHTSTKTSLIAGLEQIIGCNNHNIAILPEFEEKQIRLNQSLEEMRESNNKAKATLLGERDITLSKYQYLKSEVDRAEQTKAKYDELQMQKRAKMVDSIAMYELQRNQADVNYKALLGENTDLAKVYDTQITQAGITHGLQVQELTRIFEKEKEKNTTLKETAESTRDREIREVEDKHTFSITTLENTLGSLQEQKQNLFGACATIKVTNPFSQKYIEIEKEILFHTTELARQKVELLNTDKTIASLAERREENTQSINNADDSAQERLALLKKGDEFEIKRLSGLLDVSEESLIHFIRTEIGEQEGVLTSLLKDDVLYSTTLNPSLSDTSENLYGISIDTDALESSEYSQDSILEKITLCKERIASIKKDVEEKLNLSKESLKEKEKKLAKQHFFANEDKKELEFSISKLEAKLIMFKEELHTQKIESKKLWDEAIKNANEAYTKINLEHEIQVQKLKRVNVNHQEILNSIRTRFIEYKEELRLVSKELANKHEEQLQAMLHELDTQIQNIEISKAKALEDGGVSAEELEKLDYALKVAEKNLDDAKSFNQSVIIWREDKKFYDTLAVLEEKCSDAKRISDTAQVTYRQQVKLFHDEEKELVDKLQALDTTTTVIKSEIAEVNVAINEKPFTSYCAFFKFDAFREPIEIEKISPIIHKARNDVSELTELETTMGKQLDRLVSRFSQEKHIWFTYKNTTTQDILESVQRLRLFIEGGGLSETKELVAQSIRAIQTNISDRFGNLSNESAKIESLVKKISKRLSSAVDDIAVLDDIALRYVASDNKILTSLKAISEVDMPYGDSSSLFAEPNKSNKATHLILDRFGELLKYLESERSKAITIADTFEVQLKAEENGNSTDWIHARKQIGSVGTSVIIKTLLYVTLLDTVLSMTRKDTQANIHVLLDEIGTLDQRNMREIIEFANRAGITFITAAPDAKTVDLYNRIYHYRLIRGKSKIVLGALRR